MKATHFIRNSSILFLLAGIKLLIHFATNHQYGYFRDEFYYMACAEHLDFGYVDHPPLVPLILAAVRPILGDSLFALRLTPALAGAFIVFLTGLLARQMNGDRFAQHLAALSAIIMPVFLGTHMLYSMNSFDQLFFVLSTYLVTFILKKETPTRWIILGLVMGIGLLNKISMLYFGFGFAIGLLLTPNRKFFFKKWIWISAILAFVMFLPYIIWQIQHDWPTLEFMHNAKTYKMAAISPVGFIQEQILMVHPFLLPLCVLGFYYFFSTMGRNFRLLGWISASVILLLMLLQGKGYYTAAAYPAIFAGGAIVIESFVKKRRRNWLEPAIIVVLVSGGLVIAPLALPVLPVEKFISYSNALGIMPKSGERSELGELPLHFADMFGWEEMVEAVDEVYSDLPPEERSKCAILASNYGQAGAIDFFGPEHDLPKAICPHNSYYLWGPRDYTGEVVISLTGKETLEKLFDEVTQAGIIERKYSMPYENNRPIYLCRQPKLPLQEAWPRLKNYI